MGDVAHWVFSRVVVNFRFFAVTDNEVWPENVSESEDILIANAWAKNLKRCGNNLRTAENKFAHCRLQCRLNLVDDE
jgi:hypothetical protein